MDKPDDDLDLTPEWPGPRADPIIEHGGGYRPDESTWGLAGLAVSTLVLATSGSLGMVGAGLVASLVGVPPTLATLIAALVFVATIGVGFPVIFRAAVRRPSNARRRTQRRRPPPGFESTATSEG